MKTTSQRRLAAFQLDASDSAPVAFLVVGKGDLVGITGEEAAQDGLGLPRWLVRQVGYVEGVASALRCCCSDCRAHIRHVSEAQLDLWHSL